MREIKFRGLTQNGVWVYGDLINYISRETAILEQGFSKYGFEATEIYRRTKVKHETVGEFTGLHDKNGKEIYEGDIVKIIDANVEDGTFVVEWEDGIEFCIGFGLFSCFEYEVIGNIFENADISKPKEE